MSTPHPDPEDLALAALPAEAPDPQIVAHLADCASCREHVEELAHTVALAKEGAADAYEQAAPARVWAAIVDELGSEWAPSDGAAAMPVLRADGPGRVHPQPAQATGRRPWWRAAAVPVAAALVALVVGVGIGAWFGRDDAGGRPSSTIVAQLRPVGVTDPEGTGTMSAAERAGVRTMVIDVRGVTDTGGADYLEAWLMNRDGTQIVALGTLTRGSSDNGGSGYTGSFTVPANLPLTQLDVVDISAEHYDGDAAHSGLSILRGTLF